MRSGVIYIIPDWKMVPMYRVIEIINGEVPNG